MTVISGMLARRICNADADLIGGRHRDGKNSGCIQAERGCVVCLG